MRPADMVAVKKAATKILASTLNAGDLGSVNSIFGRNDSGVTSDRSKLADTIASFSPCAAPTSAPNTNAPMSCFTTPTALKINTTSAR
jgi:hypothetical protein